MAWRGGPIWLVVVLMAMAVLSWVPIAGAFPQYSGDPGGGCNDCHGGFRTSPYTSLADGVSWGDDLHDVHRTTMLSRDCETCHSGTSRLPVFLDSSTGGSGFPAISCVGCHGRDEDVNRGAGLRQHHFNAGETVCVDCHDDADPQNYTPVGEDFLPPYYVTPDASHVDKPTDPCSPNGEEDYAGTTIGLDNDGDLLYDQADPQCVPEPAAGTMGLAALLVIAGLGRRRQRSA